MPQKTAKKTAILFSNYENMVVSGKIRNDEGQKQVLALLQNTLDSFAPKKRISFLRKATAKPKNLYIWGNVGRGKSMLMDLFFAAVPLSNKRRIHFHAFMQEVHARIHEIRKLGLGDPVALLAKQIAAETKLLCFDELQATDVADASLLYRLFEGLFAHDVCIVSTSNRPPEELYRGGVQAERFANFIALLKENMAVAAIASPEDYRYLQGENESKTYHYPLGAGADKFIEETLTRLGTAKSSAKVENLQVQGREISLVTYNQNNQRIAFCSFNELCEKPLGAADYLTIAKSFPIVILTDIPELSAEKRNEAKRFVTLVDVLYEHKTKLICTAEVPPEQIYDSGDGAFEFHRTVSRLTEMGSVGYIGVSV